MTGNGFLRHARAALRRLAVRCAPAVLLALALAAPGAWRPATAQGPPEATHIPPAFQPPLAALDDSTFWELRDLFNASGDRTRLLAVLSPT